MKKLLLVLLLFTGFNIHSQKYNTQKRQLEQKLKKEVEKDYDSLDTTKIKKIRDQITFLKRKANNENIDKTETVIYDFQTKKYINSLVIPIVGEPIVLKIININRLAYDVSIKSSDVAIVDEYFDDEIKTAIKNSNNSTGTITNFENKKIEAPEVNSIDRKDKREINNKSEIDKLVTELGDKKIKIDQINNTKIPINDSIEDLKKNITNENVITQENKQKNKEELKLRLKDIEEKNNEINILQNEMNEINNKLINLRNTDESIKISFELLNKYYFEIVNLSQSMIEIEKQYLAYKQFALTPLLSPKEYKDKVIIYDIINRRDYFKTEIKKFTTTINDFNNQFYSNMNNWNIFENIDGTSKQNLRSKYQQIKDEVDKIKNSIDALDLPTKLLKVESINTILSNKKAYEIVSSPIQPFEDYVTFDVEIKNRDSNKLSEYDDNRKFTYMEYTQGGVRFDFSTGVVFNFGGNNNKYQISNVKILEDDVQIDKKQIVLADKNDFTPMLSAMFHTSFRRNGIWAFGLTLGASINVETFQLNSLFPGISLLIGKKQKFILTTGPAFRQVDVLKNNYNTETNYDTTEFNDTSELTSKQFKIGGFVGITYNLTQKQRGKFKINGNE